MAQRIDGTTTEDVVLTGATISNDETEITSSNVKISDKIVKINSDDASGDTGFVFGNNANNGSLYYDGTEFHLTRTTADGDATTITDDSGANLRCYDVIPKVTDTNDLGTALFKFRYLNCIGINLDTTQIATGASSFASAGYFLEHKSAESDHGTVNNMNWYNSSVSLSAGIWLIKVIGYATGMPQSSWLNVGCSTSTTISMSNLTRENFVRDAGNYGSADMNTHYMNIFVVTSTTTYYGLVARGTNDSGGLYSTIHAYRLA